MRTAIYARFSTELQQERSIEDQFALCRAYAAKNGHDVIGTYDDLSLIHISLSLLDFPFPGAAFASRNVAEGGGEGRKIRSFLGEPERPKCCTSRQNPPGRPKIG